MGGTKWLLNKMTRLCPDVFCGNSKPPHRLFFSLVKFSWILWEYWSMMLLHEFGLFWYRKIFFFFSFLGNTCFMLTVIFLSPFDFCFCGLTVVGEPPEEEMSTPILSPENVYMWCIITIQSMWSNNFSASLLLYRIFNLVKQPFCYSSLQKHSYVPSSDATARWKSSILRFVALSLRAFVL